MQRRSPNTVRPRLNVEPLEDRTVPSVLKSPGLPVPPASPAPILVTPTPTPPGTTSGTIIPSPFPREGFTKSSVILVNGAIQITQSFFNDTAQISEVGPDTIKVTATTQTLHWPEVVTATFPRALVTKGISWVGSNGHDRVVNDTNLPLFADGGPGNDTIQGGAAADVLAGGDGDDNVYGMAGTDSLFGDFGNDGLFGGADPDLLVTGLGKDRVLDYTWVQRTRKWEDSVRDANWIEDARVGFENGRAINQGSLHWEANSWVDREVVLVDSALTVLHRATRNTRLLTKADGKLVTFVRYGNPTGAVGETLAWNQAGTIGMPNRAFGSQDGTRGIVFHEMGHNWDREFNSATWDIISGWTEADKQGDPRYLRGTDPDETWYYLASRKGTFVSSYARTNPKEDFAESFENYFANLGGFSHQVSTDIKLIPGKQAFFDNMVAALSR